MISDTVIYIHESCLPLAISHFLPVIQTKSFFLTTVLDWYFPFRSTMATIHANFFLQSTDEPTPEFDLPIAVPSPNIYRQVANTSCCKYFLLGKRL